MQAIKLAKPFCWVIFVILFTSPQVSAADDKLKIFVSVLPQKLFVERIGGDSVDVGVMVKSGFSPATYEPSPRQIAALAKAQLYIRIGVPFEQAWLPRIISVNPEMLMIDARTGIELLEMAEHDHHHEHNHGNESHGEKDEDVHKLEHDSASETDPHLWTDPRLVIKIAEQIRQQLTTLKPENTEIFDANYTAFVTELEELDNEVRTIFAEHEANTNKKFLVFHPSWGYFAAAYGPMQLAIEAEGKEPGAKALKALVKQARDAGVKTIFVQPQFDQRAARQIAKAIDGNVVALDPLTEDYFETMRRAARLIAGADDDK